MVIISHQKNDMHAYQFLLKEQSVTFDSQAISSKTWSQWVLGRRGSLGASSVWKKNRIDYSLVALQARSKWVGLRNLDKLSKYNIGGRWRPAKKLEFGRGANLLALSSGVTIRFRFWTFGRHYNIRFRFPTFRRHFQTPLRRVVQETANITKREKPKKKKKTKTTDCTVRVHKSHGIRVSTSAR